MPDFDLESVTTVTLTTPVRVSVTTEELAAAVRRHGGHEQYALEELLKEKATTPFIKEIQVAPIKQISFTGIQGIQQVKGGEG